MKDSGKPSLFKPLLPGLSAFLAGTLLWVTSAGLLFFAALPLMALGVFLLVFAASISPPSDKRTRLLSWCTAVAAACCLGATIWSPI